MGKTLGVILSVEKFLSTYWSVKLEVKLSTSKERWCRQNSSYDILIPKEGERKAKESPSKFKIH